ncbi:uncharacterized protein [Typha latifolia]|uniref:uncharacterized protein n=1 Tax=Typha latifolia TaxID=4733 RepID=UPI003C2D28B5
MSLLISNLLPGSGTLAAPCSHLPRTPPSSTSLAFLSPCSTRRSSHVARARKGLSSRSRRPDNRGKKGSVTTTKEVEEEEAAFGYGASSVDGVEGGGGDMSFMSTTPMPEIPGDERDFWEGPQWNAFGFFIQYQWAFGIVFALIACGIAVSTYNEGATDFRETPAFKESIGSQELLEEPEASNSDVFEGNPTEVAPSLE